MHLKRLRTIPLATLHGSFFRNSVYPYFGVSHFAIPFLLPPNTVSADVSTAFATLHIADFVIPGVFALAFLSLIFIYTKNLVSAGLLAFLYAGGIVLHTLFFLGLVPPVLVVPSPFFLAAGIVLDALAIGAIYKIMRRKQALMSYCINNIKLRGFVCRIN